MLRPRGSGAARLFSTTAALRTGQRRIQPFRKRALNVEKSSLLVPGPKYQLMEMDPDDRIDWREIDAELQGKTAGELVHDVTQYPENVLMPLFAGNLVSMQNRKGRSFTIPAHYVLRAGDLLGIPKVLPLHLSARLTGDAVVPRKKLSLDEIKLVRSWVLFKNDDCIVLNKPPAVPCEPSRGTALSVFDLLPGLQYSSDEMPKLATSLEKDASGCLVIARTKKGLRHLNKFLRVPRAPSFCYWAAIARKPKVRQGRVEMNLELEKSAAGDRVVVRMEKGPTTVTSRLEYSVISESKHGPAWVSFYPLTLRRNEIRIAASMILKAPILGDTKYGGDAALPYDNLRVLVGKASSKLSLHLHCHQVSLPYETLNSQRIVVQAPAPPHMRSMWQFMGWDPKYRDPYLNW
ncbi:RNA pseudouridine synthase 3 [Diplonema papillatum]|nr:RNA pseudouridine synthase 3 [Diplonema papillatum]